MTAAAQQSAASGADASFEQRFARVEALLGELSHSTDPMLEHAAREVLSTVLELHRRGLARALEIAAGDATVREALARDACVSAMLLLHGLHPIALGERVSRMLQTLRARFQSKLENIESELKGAIVIVRVVPAASACGSTRQALQNDIVEALLSVAPDADSVSVELAQPAPALVTLRRSRDASQENGLGGTR